MAIDKISPSLTSALSILQGGGSGSVFTTRNLSVTTKDGKVSNNPQDVVDILMKGASDDDRAKFKAQIDQTNQLVQQLKSGSAGSPAQKKADAKQKIQQIKAQLQMVRLLAAIDPKAAARKAAQLARELSAAARDYADGSSTMDVGAATGGATVAAAAPAAATTATATATDGSAGAVANGTTVDGATAVATEAASAAPVAASAAAEASVDTAASADAEGADGDAAAGGAASAGADAAAVESEAKAAEEKGDQTPAEQARADYLASIQQKVAGMQKSAGDRQADNEFAKEVRQIANELRGIIDRAKQLAKQDKKKDPGLDHELQEGSDALKDVDKSLGIIASPYYSSVVDSSAVAAPVAVATPTPSVDVTV